jgi:hypothetical protein
MPALYVNLMPKDQDLGYQRSSRPQQPDQRRPNKAARFPHRTEALRDSASAVSPIRFTTGTGLYRLEILLYRFHFPFHQSKVCWKKSGHHPRSQVSPDLAIQLNVCFAPTAVVRWKSASQKR